ncbi:MAG: putative toxin-antitoxin system toxin component, PIN family [Woeseiaceae bacterium]
MRVVFDTNIFVSAFILPGSRANEALNYVVQVIDRLVVSKAIIDELLGVLARKFARDADELARAAVFLSDLADIVHPRGRIDVLQDDADNRVLECARAGKADLIVTGDKAMLELGSYRKINILSLRGYLELHSPGG